MTVHLKVLPDDLIVEIAPSEPILRADLRAGVPHVHACGGNARCSTCRVIVLAGLEHCRPRNEQEAKLAARLCLPPEIRLACQTTVTGDVTCRRLVLDEQDAQMIARNLAEDAPGITGEERRLAILFADIRGFTRLSEALPAYDVVHLLNRYFLAMGKVITRHGGVINNYMGDGLMALFGVDDAPDAVANAVRAGLGMLTAVEEVRTYLRSAYKLDLSIGIGVHVGDVVVGRVGAEGTKQLTAIGDAVNFASRIEGATKDAGVALLVSADVRASLGPRLRVGRSLSVSVKGKVGEHVLHEALSVDTSPRTRTARLP